jgi:RHS repeat-associated protein
MGYNSAGQVSDVTDPKGLLNKTYYDLAGRTTKTIENYVNGTVSDTDDKTVEYTYGTNGQMATLKADLTGGGFQETKWVYGIISPIVSNDVLKEMQYPDPSSGSASTSEKDGFTYNQLGQILTKTDRNGNVHSYSYDILGRQISDAISTLGSGLDGTVRRIDTAFDGQGNAYLITSYDAASAGNIFNQVQREFNGLGQMTKEWQAVGGAVNTGTSPNVQYAYSFAPSGSTNHSRLTSITYPNGRVITYNYASGLADTISRLSSITDGATTLESYAYLGLSTVVKRTLANGIALDYTTPLPFTQGASNGSTATSSGTGGDVAWTNPSNALVSDNSRATATLTAAQNTKYLTVTDFRFSVPSSATIVGVDVGVERKNGGSLPDHDNTVQLVAGGSAVGNNEAHTGTNWPASDATDTYGGASDNWSAGLTPSDANVSGCGVRIRATASAGGFVNATPGVDDVQLTVHYTMPTGDAGDKYTGLDRFGRVVDQAWVDGSGNVKDRRQYGYDRDSNRLYSDNLVSTSNSELHTYDGLNQLTTFARGTLNSTKTAISGSPTRSQSWDFDALGNFDSQTTDGTTQTRTANKQNEITSISSATTPTYDPNGNLTKDETGRTFKYDAWNRLVEVRNSGGTLLATYRYDALNRRIRETRGSTTTDLYYSSGWQVLEERIGTAVQVSYVWSPIYVDAMIARDRDTDANGSLDERLYVIQDANFNVTALMDTSGTVVERYAYDPFGGLTILTGAWGSRTSSSYAWKYQHQGLKWDADLGGIDSRYRVLGPTLGRFYQMDPIQFDGGDVNLYRAIADEPIAHVEPLGLDWDPSKVEKLLWAVPSGVHTLNLIKDHNIPIMKATRARIEYTNKKTGKVTEGFIYGWTTPAPEVIINASLDDFTAAATIVHEVEHAQWHFTNKGGGEEHARQSDLMFYFEHNNLWALPDSYFVYPDKGCPVVRMGKKGLEINGQEIVRRWGPDSKYGSAPDDSTMEYKYDKAVRIRFGDAPKKGGDNTTPIPPRVVPGR